MKMTKEHYEHLKFAIDALPPHVKQAIRENAANDNRVKDLNKRVRWDYLWACELSTWISDNCYSYMNDDHIDTALKAIVAGK